MTNTITYYSNHAPAGQEWLAQVFMPNGQKWLVHSYGATEAEAVEKITDLYEKEKNKFQHVQMVGRGNREVLSVAQSVENNNAKSGRGSHFVGKVWLIHSFSRAKIRVDQSDVEKYLAEGWQRGGPRSK